MRVLIVGTNRPCHFPLHEHGHDTVLFISRSRLHADDLIRPYQHIVALEDGAPEALWLKNAMTLHDDKPFDAVVSYIDSMQPLAYAIASRLKVFCALDIDLVNSTSNKSRMRTLLDIKQIPSCKHIFCHGEEGLRAAIGEIGLPCIVKPVAGEGSAGVAKITSVTDIPPALERLGEANLTRGIIVEEFIVGDEYSVEAISGEKHHHIIAITKKFKDAKTFVEIGHLVPAPIDDSVQLQIKEYVECILNAFNFKNCPSHTELILSRNGPRIIETHTRNGGDRIIELVKHATDVDIYDLAAQQSVGANVDDLLPQKIDFIQSAAVWFANPGVPETQQLLEVREIDNVSKLPYIKSVELLKKPGTKGSYVQASMDRSASAVAVGQTPSEALERAQNAIHSLEFIYTWKSGKIISDEIAN